MKQTLRVAAYFTLAGIILYYPAMKLYEMIAEKLAEGEEVAEEGETHVKAFVPAFRGKHKPHHRHPHEGNGTPDTNN